MSYAGAQKALIHHVQDRVDFVTLMNYLDGVRPRGLAPRLGRHRRQVRYGPTESLFETSPPDPMGRALLPLRDALRGGEEPVW